VKLRELIVSLWLKNFVKHWIKSVSDDPEGLIQLLSIGPQQSLAGMILFSSDATLHFDLSEHTDIAALSTAINPGLPYDGGSTNTAAALSLLLSSAQDGSMGLRPGHPAIAIVITDGESNVNQAQTIPNAQSVHASNIFQQVYAVGVGNADLTELNAIASDPSLVFNTNSFDSTAIQQLQQTLSERLCDGELTCCMACVLELHLTYRQSRSTNSNGRPSFYGSIGVR